MFKLGQKVVCIEHYGEKWHRRYPRVTTPSYGAVYTVRAHCDLGSKPGIVLVEITNPEVRFRATKRFGEASFYAENFRPLVERKTDISIFTAMLTTTRETVDV